MELRQLRALIAIAETGSVSRAAERLHIVQPALSRQVRLLEEELGKAVFERTHTGMVPTADGLTLIQAARRALFALDQAVDEIRPRQHIVSGTVTVGLLPSTCELLSGALLSAVKLAYPQLRLRLRAGMAGELQEWVESGEVDVALLYGAREHPDVDVVPLLDEPLYLIGPPGPDAERADFAPLETLAQQPLVLPTHAHSVRRIIEQSCLSARIPLNVVAESDDIPLTKALVTAGIGYSVLAGIAVAEDILANRLIAVPLGSPPLQRRVAIARHTGADAAAAAQPVARILEARVKAAVRQNRWPGARLVAFEIAGPPVERS